MSGVKLSPLSDLVPARPVISTAKCKAINVKACRPSKGGRRERARVDRNHAQAKANLAEAEGIEAKALDKLARMRESLAQAERARALLDGPEESC